MSNEKQIILVNGTFKECDAPAVTATSRGLMYGDGCFETLRAYNGRFFKLKEHIKRLEKGLSYLAISCPDDLQFSRIDKLLSRLIQENELRKYDAVVRLQVWREGGRGYATSSNSAGYAVTANKLNPPDRSYSLATVPTRRIPSTALPARYKFTNGINYIKAAGQARAKGADDALMQTVEGWISETTVANIFWMKGETIYTPSVNCDVLPGITRKAILKCFLEGMDKRVEAGKYRLESIKKADIVWICNSVKEIAPVHQIDQSTFKVSSAFFEEVGAVFQSYVQSKL